MTDGVLTETKSRQLLEAYVQARPEAASPLPFPVTPRPAGSPLPLTPAQRQLWLHAQMEADSPLYNEPLTVRYTGALDCAALQQGFTEIVRRHEAWHTTFPSVQGMPVQVVQEPFPVNLPLHDLRPLPAEQRESAATEIATALSRIPFDLTRGPLFRAAVVRVADEDYRLFVTLHHLIFDGFSGYRVFLPELSALYKSYLGGKASSLPDLPYQFGDYAVWRERQIETPTVERSLNYWKGQLAGPLSALTLPFARAGSIPRSFRGAVRSVSFPATLSEALRRLGHEEGATLFMTLVAAFTVLLHRYSGQEDILIGTNTAGRNCPGSEKLLGYFLNTVVLRTSLSDSLTFRQVLQQVRQVTLEALEHDDIPLDLLAAELQPQRDRSRNPFFQVLFSLEPPVSRDQAEWDLTCIDVETGAAKYELSLVVDDRPDGLLCRFIYNTDLFEDGAICRMQGHWRTLLDAVVAEPERRISELSLLTEQERQQLVVQWNATAAPRSQVLVHELFAEQARKTPQALAVECGNRRLSYSELNERAGRLAQVLASMGAGPNVAVAVCVERSVEMVVAILGILQAGATYVPLDPAYPRQRLEYVLADCQAAVLLTQTSLASNRLSREIPILLLDSEQWSNPNPETATQNPGATFDDLAYILYTSGSTGMPKGVMVTHGNLAHSNQARLRYYKDPVGSFLLLSSYAFDSSVAGIFHTLTSGGTLVVPPPEFRWQPKELAELISRTKISHTLSFPTLYAELLHQARPEQLASLQTVIVAGETCPRHLVNSHYRVLPHVSLFNEYGPTEATVWSSVHECEPGETGERVPIGRPISNTQLYVLDGNRQPVPAEVPGELYIGGDGVTKGYFNQPGLTRLSFVPNHFAGGSDARLYRTGDLARFQPNGNLEFLGRMDQQVKIRGLRVELEEIETILAQHPDVREAAVVADSDGSAELQLAAYVVAREEFATSQHELRSFLKSRLPGYAVPSAFHFVNALPRTPNGKLDRQNISMSLETSEAGLGASARAAVTSPRTEMERRLLTIWQRVLKTDTEDVTADFFELGGHSLLAAQLLAQIEKEFGRSLSLAFVFQAPTVQQMAESLRTAGQSLRQRAIIPIQPHGSNPPLFWVRGGPRFRLLAQKLGPNQPFLGLDLPSMDGGRLPSPYRLEDIATLLIQAVREEQPKGPYHLAGLCVNAVLAYEIARQLSESGEEIALLALFDGHNQAYYKNPLKDGRYSARIKYHFSNLRQMEARDASHYLRDRLDEARRKIERITWQLTSTRNEAGMQNTDNIVHPAFHRYEPQAYAGKMLLLQSSDWPAGPYFDFKLGWNDLVTQGIEFHWIPGDHPSMFTEPNVNLVANTLRQHLAGSIAYRQDIAE